MTIINLVQNNHRNSHPHPAAELAWELRFRVLSGWVAQLSHLHREAGKELTLLQAGLAPQEQEKSVARLIALQADTSLGLERISLLLKKEPEDSTWQHSLPPGTPAWVWLSLQIFFETWNPEMAAFELWTLVRPVLTAGEGPTEKDRENAASFYELALLLFNAAWELHQLQGNKTSVRCVAPSKDGIL